MKRILIVLTALTLTGCATAYKTTFDHTERGPYSVHVVPVVAKEEMDVQMVTQDSSAVSAQYGLVGALVGSVMDAVVNKKNAIRAERLAEVVREMTIEYDLIATAKQSVVSVGNGERWEIVQIDDPITTVGYDDVANNAFNSGDAEAVVVLDYDYALTPAADQVRVKVDQRVYLRSTEKKDGKNRKVESLRSFTYYSPKVTLVTRPYNVGEKEEIVSYLQENYGERIAARPDEKDDLEKVLEKEIEDIEKSDTIPLALAMRETWTSDQLSNYLDQSVEHVAYMLRHDWGVATVPEDPKVRSEDTYFVIYDTGFGYNTKGKDVGQLDGNEIYRAQTGHMHSVPMPE